MEKQYEATGVADAVPAESYAVSSSSSTFIDYVYYAVRQRQAEKEEDGKSKM